MSDTKKTNIVFILTDDQGVWAAGCYGNPEIRTPNIDRIAATGVRFENFFITIPVCLASRASFLTGRIRDLKARVEAWFAKYVVADKDGLEYSVSGAGQLRPIGGKREDGTKAFDEVVEKSIYRKK